MWRGILTRAGARGFQARTVLVLGLLLATPAIAAAEPDEASAWTGGASASWYFVQDGTNYGIATGRADHGPLHLEFRYNYEALHTGSALVGWNLEFGDTVTLELTPLVGAMVGQAAGPIVGLEISLGWGPLAFSSEDEWVYDFRGTSGFFYAWTELSVRPAAWVRVGVVLQRTRLFHTAREVIFGPLLGFSFWKLELNGYWFQPGGVDQLLGISLGVSF